MIKEEKIQDLVVNFGVIVVDFVIKDWDDLELD